MGMPSLFGYRHNRLVMPKGLMRMSRGQRSRGREKCITIGDKKKRQKMRLSTWDSSELKYGTLVCC